MISVALLVLQLAIGAANAREPQDTLFLQFAESSEAPVEWRTITRVIDGDTIAVGGN